MTATGTLGEAAVRRRPPGWAQCLHLNRRSYRAVKPPGPGAGVRGLVSGFVLSLCSCGLGMLFLPLVSVSPS